VAGLSLLDEAAVDVSGNTHGLSRLAAGHRWVFAPPIGSGSGDGVGLDEAAFWDEGDADRPHKHRALPAKGAALGDV